MTMCRMITVASILLLSTTIFVAQGHGNSTPPPDRKQLAQDTLRLLTHAGADQKMLQCLKGADKGKKENQTEATYTKDGKFASINVNLACEQRCFELAMVKIPFETYKETFKNKTKATEIYHTYLFPLEDDKNEDYVEKKAFAQKSKDGFHQCYYLILPGNKDPPPRKIEITGAEASNQDHKDCDTWAQFSFCVKEKRDPNFHAALWLFRFNEFRKEAEKL